MSFFGKRAKRQFDPALKQNADGVNAIQVGELRFDVRSPGEAKEAINQLRSVKRELLSEKRALANSPGNLPAGDEDPEGREHHHDASDGRVHGDSGSRARKDRSTPAENGDRDQFMSRRAAINRQLRELDSGISELEQFILSAAIAQHQASALHEQRMIADLVGD